MSIVNAEAAVVATSEWIKDRIHQARAKTAVVGVSGGADSALVAILCKKVVPTVGVIMPCHSSEAGIKRAHELCTAFEIPYIAVPLDEPFRLISEAVEPGLNALNISYVLLDSRLPGNLESGALRSCLRAPTLDYVAKRTNGLIIGTGNRDEDEMTRYFQKRGDGCVDISPIAKYHKSEVYELLRYLKCPDSIVKAVPSADLWGPDSGQEDEKELGLTYEEVEWGIRELQDKTYSEKLRAYFTGDPSAMNDIANIRNHYTEKQRGVLNQLAMMELTTRHKALPPPVFDPRAIPGLVS